MNKIINVALSSYGMSGRIFHAPFLQAHPWLNLAVIMERSKNESRQRYPAARIARDYRDILGDRSIGLVVINTPNPLHYPMAKAALLAGKHVILEKPFTTTVAEGRELISLAQDKGLMLSVYHNRRLQSGFKTVQKLLAEKSLGNVKSCEISIDRYRPQPGPKKWKEENNPGAGLLYDLGSHLLDEALMLFGQPQALCADLRIERDAGQACDYFHVRLDYSEINGPKTNCPDTSAEANSSIRGCRIILKASMLAREAAPAYVIHGDKGSYVKCGQDLQEERLAAGVCPTDPHWADEGESDWGILHTDSGRHKYPTVAGTYQDYYDNIYRHLNAGEALLVTPEQALRVIEMIDLVQRSAREQTCITLN